MSPRGEDDAIVSAPLPQTPLLGAPRHAPMQQGSADGVCSNLSRGKVIVLVTLAVVAVLVAAIIILSVSNKEPEAPIETEDEGEKQMQNDGGRRDFKGGRQQYDHTEQEDEDEAKFGRRAKDEQEEEDKAPCPLTDTQLRLVDSLDEDVLGTLVKLSKLLNCSSANAGGVDNYIGSNDLLRSAPTDPETVNKVVEKIIKDPSRLEKEIEKLDYADRVRAKQAIKVVHEKYNQVEEDEKRAQLQQGEPDALASTDPSSQSQGGPISRVGVKNNNSGGDKHRSKLDGHIVSSDSGRFKAFKRAIKHAQLYKYMFAEPKEKNEKNTVSDSDKDGINIFIVKEDLATLKDNALDELGLGESVDERVDPVSVGDVEVEDDGDTFGNVYNDLGEKYKLEAINFDELLGENEEEMWSMGDSSQCEEAGLLACKRGGCYLKDGRCDRYVDCGDNSDEAGCTCEDYLPKDSICDGYYDCRDGQDEEGCTGCASGSFACNPYNETSVCLNGMDTVCDNVWDCDSGADEVECVVFAPIEDPHKPKAKQSMHVGGLVYWKVGGEYHPLSLHTKDKASAMSVFKSLAVETCMNIMKKGEWDEPEVQVMKYDRTKMGNLPTFAHLFLNNVPEEEEVSLGDLGKFDIKVDDSGTDDCLLGFINCGPPVCGSRSRTAGMIKVARAKSLKDEKKNKVETRIVGGKDSWNWPSIVAVYRDGVLVCGGTIIDEQWIVTAAHCLTDFKVKEYYYDVVAGLLRRSSDSPVTHSRHIVEAYIHPEFEGETFSNDIALAKVNRPFVLSSHVCLACLPDAPAVSDLVPLVPSPGDECWAAGWGNIYENRDPAEMLQEVEIPILDSCKSDYNNIEKQICGGEPGGGADACQGDSGGPLYCKHPVEVGRWYLAGVISHGEGCAQAHSPGVYTRVYAYKDWIAKVLGEVSERSEKNTPTSPSNKPLTQCLTHYCDHRCLPDAKTCNRRVDCFDGSDENCTITSEGVWQLVNPQTNQHGFSERGDWSYAYGYLKSKHMTRIDPNKVCAVDEFQCATTRECIPISKRCDGQTADCKDYSDEYDCKCVDYLDETFKCDSHVDCYDWEDEGKECDYCSYDPELTWYCHLSKKCIKKSQVCDTKPDCKYKEDERYCINLINSPTIYVRGDGRPVQGTSGIVAVNEHGHWFPACTESWDEDINNKICRYMGRTKSESFTRVSRSRFPSFEKEKLGIRYLDGRPVYPRQKRAAGDEGDVVDELLAVKQLPEFAHGNERRNVSFGSDNERAATSYEKKDCFFVQSTCTDSTTCGRMPLYSQLGKKIPDKPYPGLFPWHVNFYINGDYACGGTLMTKSWILTHNECARKFRVGINFIVARAGQYRDLPRFDAYNQVRSIVHEASVDDTNIRMLLVDKPFFLNEYVNIACLPSITWVPVWTQCYITGRANLFLNYQFQTQIKGICPDYVDDNDWSFCTKQTKATNFCMDSWSGALVCPDNKGTFYAVGTYFSDVANCDVSGGEKSPEKFETLVSARAREGIIDIISNTPPKVFKKPPCVTHRCPLGRCLEKEKVCNLLPDCADGSDEKRVICDAMEPETCKVDPFTTKCVCAKDSEFKCDNNRCVTKTKYCDNKNDCGDNSDEPKDCATSCTSLLKYLHPKKLCDSKIDCYHANQDNHGGDEGNEACCPDDNVRCVEGHIHPATDPTGDDLKYSDQCIPRESICPATCSKGTRCTENKAHFQNCIILWPNKVKGLPPGLNLASATATDQKRTVFGQQANYANAKGAFEGFLTVIVYGKEFVYCASDVWNENENKNTWGFAFCKHKKQSLDEVKVFATSGFSDKTKTFIGEYNNITLNAEQQPQFEKCLLVYIKCKK